eukprot:202571_1
MFFLSYFFTFCVSVIHPYSFTLSTLDISVIMSLTTRSVLLILLCILITPLHIYGWFKFYQFRGHFVIQNRFPVEVIVVSIATFLFSYVSMIRSSAIDKYAIEWSGSKLFALEALILSLCYLSTNMVFYRAHLVYLQHLQQNGDTYRRSVGKHRSSMVLLAFIVITTLVLFVTSLAVSIVHSPSSTLTTVFLSFWMVTVVIGIAYVIIRKLGTKESLGIYIEIAASIIIMVVLCGVNMIPDEDVKVIMQNVCQNLMAILPLLNALLLLRKHEGSLNAHEVMSKYVQEYIDTSTDENSLFTFLQNEENYTLFSSYLRDVFAMEHLAFVTNVLIFRHSVWRYKAKANFMLRMSQLNQEDTNEAPNIDHHTIYRLKFEYLESMYKSYASRVVKEVTSNDPIFYDLKDNLFALSKHIYNQFIEDTAIQQIRITSSDQNTLSVVFTDEQNKDKFNCFDDFLHLYHNAMVESWTVLQYCYGFGFKK